MGSRVVQTRAKVASRISRSAVEPVTVALLPAATTPGAAILPPGHRKCGGVPFRNPPSHAPSLTYGASRLSRESGRGGSMRALRSLLVTTVSASALLGGAPGAAHAECGATHWVGSWFAPPSDTTSLVDPYLSPTLAVGDQTYRIVITPHRGGGSVRVHLTNRFRPLPLTIAHATVALRSDGAGVQPDSLRTLTFDGAQDVTLAPGADIVSDPVDFPLTAWQPIVVGINAAGIAPIPTEHFNADATSYYTPPDTGDHTADPDGAAFGLSTTAALIASGVDVQAPADVATVVAFGDSITDGYISGNVIGTPQNPEAIDTNARYTDFLQRRFDDAGVPVSVLNSGISGNRVQAGGFIPEFGPSGLDRLDADAISQAGVTDVIVAEGINDLGIPIAAGYDQLVAAYTTLITRLHAAGLRVHLGTLLPASNALTDGILTMPAADPVRIRVNDWIRTQQLSDSFIDFDAALRDPANPSTMDRAYAGPDNLHPNPTGYRKMADTVDLSTFSGGHC